MITSWIDGKDYNCKKMDAGHLKNRGRVTGGPS